jgi:hypothetical protein
MEQNRMSPADRYQLLQSLLLRARALGTASDVQLDAVLEEMDAVWSKMSPGEQLAADDRAATLPRIPAPDDLGLTEVVKAVGDHQLPRRVA